MRKELREALERFLADIEYARDKVDHVLMNGEAAARLYAKIVRIGGLDAALADDPTDTAPDLAAVVASQGVALEALGQQFRDLAGKVRLLEGDLKRAEDALLDVACERTAPDAGWLVEPVELKWWALMPPLTQYAQGARWGSEDVEIWGFENEVRARKGQRVGVRPDGRLEVVS